jgi:BNR repeat-containing family member
MKTLSMLSVMLCLLLAIPTQAQPGPTVLSRKTLSLQGSTRGTAYCMSNKIITDDGKMFVAWLDHVASIQIKTYDLKTMSWGPTVLLGKGKDNHGGPALTMDSKGYLYAVFGPHHGPFQFRVSLRPYDASEWSAVERFGVVGTYPSLVCGPDDTLHLTYRGGPDPPKLRYQRRPYAGKWSAPRDLMVAGVAKGYTQYGNALCVDASNTLHLTFHIYDNYPKAGKSAGYLRSPDGGDKWETAMGKAIVTPANPKSPCFIEQGAMLDMRVSNVALSPTGYPYLVVNHRKKEPMSARLWHHDGSAWKSLDLLPIVQKVYPKMQLADMGTLTFDRQGRFYISMSINAPDGSWGSASQEVILLTSTDGGKSFNIMPISTPDPQVACWLPSIERPFSSVPIDTPAVLYTHGGPGKGCSEGDATEIVFVRLGWKHQAYSSNELVVAVTRRLKRAVKRFTLTTMNRRFGF